jgi:hypothetical protein
VLAFSIFVVPIVLRAGNGHHRNRCGERNSQKKRTEISVSTVHVGLLWGDDLPPTFSPGIMRLSPVSVRPACLSR